MKHSLTLAAILTSTVQFTFGQGLFVDISNPNPEIISHSHRSFCIYDDKIFGLTQGFFESEGIVNNITELVAVNLEGEIIQRETIDVFTGRQRSAHNSYPAECAQAKWR
jgi:hypothetical protein